MSSKSESVVTNGSVNPALVPKLRFPEFLDAMGWVLEPIGNVYSFKGNNSLSRDKLNYEAGSVKNIHYGDIHTKFSTHFDVTKELVPFINESEEGAIRDGSLCADGDMIFADASEDMADIGKSIEVVNLNGECVAAGLHTILARRIGDRIALGFGGHVFKSGYVRSQIQKEAQGAKVLGISANRMRNLRLPLPPTEVEQQKIADCLSSLDELIAAQARKVDVLKTHKKGLMQKIFPREGETQPRFRFPEFTTAGHWKEKPFGDLLNGIIDFRGRTPAKLGMEWGGGKISSLSANNVKNGFIDYAAECNWGSEELYQRWMGGVSLQKDDIVFTMEAPLGKALLLPDSEKYILSQRVVAFKTKPAVKNPFLIQLIWSDGFQRAIDELATGSTAKGINQKALKTVLVKLPEPAEQQHIANCLSSLDTLITAATQKLETLKTHKKGLMQQLFPSPDEATA